MSSSDVCCLFILLLDIDECLAETSGCEHYCVNTLGTYECFCRLGFRLELDQHSCICELIICCSWTVNISVFQPS